MKKVWIGSVSVAVLAGGAVGFTAWSGPRVDEAARQRTAAALAEWPGVRLVDNRIDAGFFETTHTVAVDVTCPADAPPVRIGWRSRVLHGPMPGARGLGMARIDTVFTLPGGAPLAATTRVGFGGAAITDLRSPSHTDPAGKPGALAWKGLQATLWWDARRGVAAGGTYAVTFAEAGVDLSWLADGAAVKLGPASASGQFEAGPGLTWWLRPSTGKLHVDAAHVTVGAPAGDGPAAGPRVQVDLDNIDLSAFVTVDKGLWGAKFEGAASGRAGGFAVDRVEWATSLQRVHLDTYRQTVPPLLAPLGCAAPSGATLPAAEALTGLLALLQHDPAFAVDRLAITLGKHTTEASLRVATRGVTQADIADPQALNETVQPKLFASVAARTTIPWLEEAVRRVPPQWMPPTMAKLNMSAYTRASLVRAMALSADVDPYVVRDGEALSVEAVVEAGRLTLNGKPQSWRALLAK